MVDDLREMALDLHERLGGPNYASVAASALKLSRKRARDEGPSESRIIRRSQLMHSMNQYQAKRLEGRVRLERFRGMLRDVDRLYKDRSLGQREFHEAFSESIRSCVKRGLKLILDAAPTAIASLPHIVGEADWDEHRSDFLELMDTDEYRGEVLITTPRRFGSESLLLHRCINVFSSRTTDKLRNDSRKYVCGLFTHGLPGNVGKYIFHRTKSQQESFAANTRGH